MSVRALTLKRGPPERKPVYHDAVVEVRPMPALQKGQVLVKMGAVSFNHREVSRNSRYRYRGIHSVPSISCGYAKASILA